jgi:cellobiose dehydrogenase (acceptor)
VLGLALTATASSCQRVGQNSTYDYIVVGGGPSGIITAERLSEANKKVLLIERGYGPTVATGSNETLSWNNTLTAIDLPGLSFDIGGLNQWTEFICTDTPNFAACVLGGGVTVNYMVFVRPPSHDFEKWPLGWQWSDVADAAERLYERNPGTMLPSADGKHYDNELYDVVSGFLGNLGWKSVDMLEQPDEKHQVYSYPSWNILNKMRAGPLRTYLPLAQQRDNFSLRLGTKVIRVMRDGSQATGVEVETASGNREIISLAPNGRVVLSAGSLSTPRVLFNSGIGPKSQIQTAQKNNVTLPDEKDWIELPVGQGVKDHPIFNSK